MRVKTIVAAALASLGLLASARSPQAGGAETNTPSDTASAPLGAPPASGTADSLTVSRIGGRPVQPGPAEQFTGTVRIEPLFAAIDSARAAGMSVSFDPGARTAWHSHPRGQVLIVTAGTGRVQRRDGPIEEIRPGDVVRIPPGVEHWHGAAPTTAMTHIAILEHSNRKVVDWGRHVTDAEYGSR